MNEKTKQLYSFSYFQASFSNLPNVILEQSDSILISLDPIASSKVYNLSNTKLVDASLSYSKKYREASNRQVTIKAQKYILGNMYSIEKFEEISPEIFKEFDAFCSEIVDNNIELSFFLAPYHPIVYEKIKQDYQIVLETENKLLEFAKEINIKCLGSFNPAIEGIDSKGFYDGMHSKENTIKKIMKVRTHNNIYKSLGNW